MKNVNSNDILQIFATADNRRSIMMNKGNSMVPDYESLEHRTSNTINDSSSKLYQTNS
jgi:hypothetical protein